MPRSVLSDSALIDAVRSEAQQAQERLAFLAEASQLLASTLDYTTTLRNVAHAAVPRFADWCMVYLADASGTPIQVAMAYTDDSQRDLAERMQAAYTRSQDRDTWVRQVLETGIPRLDNGITPEVAANQALDDRHRRDVLEMGARARYMVPIQARGKSLGVMTFIRTVDKQPYTPEDCSLALDLAHRAGVAVDNALLHRETEAAAEAARQRANRLRALSEASLALSTTLTSAEIFRIITDQARLMTESHLAATILLDEGAIALHSPSLSDKFAAYRDYPPMQVRTGTGIYTLVARTNQPLRLTHSELLAHPDFHHFGSEGTRHVPLRGLLAVPLPARDGTVSGVILVSDKLQGDFTDEDEAMLQQVSRIAAVALENGRLLQAEQEAENRLRIQLQFTSTMADSLAEGVLALDETGCLTFLNPAGESMLGFTEAELLGAPVHSLIHPHDSRGNIVPLEQCALLRVMRTAESVRVEDDFYIRKDGSRLPVGYSAAPIQIDGRVTGAVVAFHDITERKRAEESLRLQGAALRDQERLYRLIADNATDLVMLVANDRHLQYASPSHKLILGYDHDELVKLGLRGILSILVHPADRRAIREAVRETLKTGTPETASYRVRRKDGEYVWLESSLQVAADEHGLPTGLRISSRDVTERKAFVEQLAHQAFHDPLTNLPNRALFMDRLDHALVRARRHKETVAVLFLDLDRFKVINDSLGHSVGDQLLVAMSQRLFTCVRAEDSVARLGGDEFTVLLEETAGVEQATVVAERIARSLDEPFMLSGHEIFITSSIGIVVAEPGDYMDSGVLLRDADVAMYRAKVKGKAHYEVFDSSMNGTAMERLEMETDLRRAVERGEFRLHYQPVVWLRSGEIAGLEALVRWEHPTRGLVSPDQFIALAEETGLIVPIGRWVLQEAVRQLQEWRSSQFVKTPLFMSVNLSVRQFQKPGLLSDVTQALSECGLPPESLQLEITESVMMQEDERSVAILDGLRAMGVRLAVDDFGTGYSSLSYVKRFPIDTLKIDRMFIMGASAKVENPAIVRAIIALGQALALRVTGEGIETAEQAAELVAMGCELGQGYFFSPPVSARVIEALLIRGDAGRPLR